MLDAHCGVLSSLLTLPEHERPMKIPFKKACGRILMSVENTKAIEKKREDQKRKAKLKEERKREMERRREEKAKRKQDIKAKKVQRASVKKRRSCQVPSSKKPTKAKGKPVQNVEHVGTSLTLTEEETKLYERRFENGYDLTTDERYNAWVKTKSTGVIHQPSPFFSPEAAAISLVEPSNCPSDSSFSESVRELTLGNFYDFQRSDGTG